MIGPFPEPIGTSQKKDIKEPSDHVDTLKSGTLPPLSFVNISFKKQNKETENKKMPDPETGTYKMKQETTGKSVQVQKQVDEVKGIMEKNVSDAMNRGEQLNDLEAKTLALEEGSKSFAKNTKKVSSNLWWKNMKYTAIIVGIVVAIILIILFAVFGKDAIFSMFSSSSSSR